MNVQPVAAKQTVAGTGGAGMIELKVKTPVIRPQP